MADVLELERQGWNALVSGRGAEFYGALMTADAVVVVPGMVLDREQTLASWEGVPPWTDYALTNETVVPLGPQARLVTYEVSATRPGDQGPYRARLTSVYVATEGTTSEQWRLAFHQQTPMP